MYLKYTFQELESLRVPMSFINIWIICIIRRNFSPSLHPSGIIVFYAHPIRYVCWIVTGLGSLVEALTLKGVLGLIIWL